MHYDPQGTTIGAVDLTPYLGPCRVIHAIAKGPLIRWEHLAHAVHDLPPRVLVRTYERMPVERWDPELAAYAPETVERLASLGVKLIGIDTASIDPAECKTLDSHRSAGIPEIFAKINRKSLWCIGTQSGTTRQETAARQALLDGCRP